MGGVTPGVSDVRCNEAVDFYHTLQSQSNKYATSVVIGEHAAAVDAARGAVVNWYEKYINYVGMTTNII